MKVRENHSMSNTSEYHTWEKIKARCLNPNHISYEEYGGRGITVCDRWKNSFQAFYQDMGARPSESHSIERRNNDGDYTPENCYWADKTTQSINQRIRKDNKSGFKGVSWNKNKKWESYIFTKGEKIHLGYFSTPKLAAIARDEYILENELSEFPLQILPEP